MQVVTSFVPVITLIFVSFTLVWSVRVFEYEDYKPKCGEHACQMEKKCTDSELCLDTVLIAELTGQNNTLHVRSIGVAIGKRYILSTVSSSFPKFFEHQALLFAIKGNELYLLRNARTIPRMIPGDFDAHAWNDVLLIELLNEQAFEGDDFVPISRSMPTAVGEIKVAQDGNGGFVIDNAQNPIKFNNSLISRRIEECQEAFNGLPVLVDDDHFSCHLLLLLFIYAPPLDEHYVEKASSDAEEILVGSPLYATKNGTDTRYLTGMRSFTVDDGSFIVTKLSIHCDWIEETTYGEVISVD